MTPGNRWTYAVVIDNGLIHSEWGAQNIFSFHRGALQKLIEKHYFNCFGSLFRCQILYNLYLLLRSTSSLLSTSPRDTLQYSKMTCLVVKYFNLVTPDWLI